MIHAMMGDSAENTAGASASGPVAPATGTGNLARAHPAKAEVASGYGSNGNNTTTGSSNNNSGSSSSGSGAAGGSRPSKWRGVYAAESFTEGLRALCRVVPIWVPAVTLLSGAGAYYVLFRVRLFLSQWRIAERRRAERKYDLLDNLRGVSIGPVGAVEPLGDDDGDDEDEEDDDETAVSMRDIDEFRSSLGIRLPRDEDLMSIVEKMLMVDPIPDGWVLYRTTAGIIRFMNLNTQELFFFHPGKRKEKVHIEEELKRRNRQAMESKYSFSYEDEGMNSAAVSSPSGAGATRESESSGPSPIDFGDESVSVLDDETQTSTFKRLFGYFLEKEQKRIEQDVARQRNGAARRGSSTGGSTPRGASTSGAAGNSGVSPASASLEASRRQALPASTFRVVSSSAIHGSRGGSVGGN